MKIAGLALRLLFATALACVPASAEECDQLAHTGKYRLTTECELERTFPERIVPYWETNVRRSVLWRNGAQLHYAVAEVDNELGAIVVASGRTEAMVKYKELIYDLNNNGYSVYIIDHRGQGFSSRMLDDPHKGYVEDFDDYVEDLEEFIREVVRPDEHENLFLLGHSMGGAIATLYIEKYTDVFDAAALSAPMHYPNAKVLFSARAGCAWFRVSYRMCETCYVGLLPREYDPPAFEDNDLTSSRPRYMNTLASYQAEQSSGKDVVLGGPTRRWVREACLAASSLLDNAGAITAPVLVLQAGDDSAVTPEGQDRFCAALQASSGQGCVGGGPVTAGLEQAKHEILVESDEYRNHALTLILDFFADNSGR